MSGIHRSVTLRALPPRRVLDFDLVGHYDPATGGGRATVRPRLLYGEPAELAGGMLVLTTSVDPSRRDTLRADETAVAFIRDFASSGKPVAAICHAPWLLVEAGLANGRRLTSFKSIRTDLRNAGAEVVDEPVVVDGNLITSRNPGDLDDFNGALERALESVGAAA